MKERFLIPQEVKARAFFKMDSEIAKKLWSSFTLSESSLQIEPAEELFFQIGNQSLPTLETGKEYALSVSSEGVGLVGKDFGGLMRGFLVLLMQIEQSEEKPVLASACMQSEYVLENRMVHLCIFPENDLYFIKKMIRLFALCQYTHVVIEFWGMLRFDCLKELSWPQAFTKQQAREIIEECHDLGIEPIPMFNQLGHASGSRACYGKHVVLDQNPKLQRLFTPDGWAWDIQSDEVDQLLTKVRKELYELFGPGQYMHIGCDEAYCISRNSHLREKLPSYLEKLTRQVEAEGRRPMLWMDMLLEKDIFPNCYAVGEKDEVENLRNKTSPSSVFVDWQYTAKEVPIPSLASLKGCGRDVMGAPWYDPKNYEAHVDTIVQNQLMGVMLTTWDTLKKGMRSVLGCAKKCGVKTFSWSEYSTLGIETANLLRRVSFEGNSYEDCGWAKKQIEI